METAVEQYLVDRKLQYALDAVQQRVMFINVHYDRTVHPEPKLGQIVPGADRLPSFASEIL